MHTFPARILACALVASLVALIAGCNKHHDDYYDQSSPTYQSVVVEPAKPLPIKEEKGVKYGVLQAGAVVPSNVDHWIAVSPALFKRLTNMDAPKVDEDKMAHPGYGVLTPKITTSSVFPDRKMASVSANTILPKELNGWAVMDEGTFNSLQTKMQQESVQK
ncbi:MAG TPA: hypothetical protein VKX17_19110 [Planctomycetota bacterium]|nr:hypothetical protein [Planctomycetota bacterium]